MYLFKGDVQLLIQYGLSVAETAIQKWCRYTIAKFLGVKGTEECCVVDYRSGKYCNFQLETYSPPHWFGNDSMKSIARGHLNNTKGHIHASLCSFHFLMPGPAPRGFCFCILGRSAKQRTLGQVEAENWATWPPDQFTFWFGLNLLHTTWNLFSNQFSIKQPFAFSDF